MAGEAGFSPAALHFSPGYPFLSDGLIAVGNRLVEGRLPGAGVNANQGLAGFHFLALAEIDPLHHPRNLGADRCRSQRFDLARDRERFIEIAQAHRRQGHQNRRFALGIIPLGPAAPGKQQQHHNPPTKESQAAGSDRDSHTPTLGSERAGSGYGWTRSYSQKKGQPGQDPAGPKKDWPSVEQPGRDGSVLRTSGQGQTPVQPCTEMR